MMSLLKEFALLVVVLIALTMGGVDVFALKWWQFALIFLAISVITLIAKKLLEKYKLSKGKVTL